MHHTLALRVGERLRDLGGDPHRILERELVLALQPGAERFALHVGHHVVEETLPGARVVQREDVRMLQPGGDLDLAQEPLGPHHRRQLGVQHFDGDPTVVLQVLGEEYRRHAAPTELTLDRITTGERVTEEFQEVGHERSDHGEDRSLGASPRRDERAVWAVGRKR